MPALARTATTNSTIELGARLPTYLLMTRNNAMIAAWLVVIE
jgi:hypothetical protein